jgi:acyl dehydratase
MMQTPIAANMPLPAIRIHAVNSASGAKGSIHDDEKAREMGYKGGFVPGTTVLGYMSRVMHETFGRQWLSHGQFAGRLRRPVYEGAEVTVEGTVIEPPSAENGGRVQVELRVLDHDGNVAAFASASCLVATDA